MIWSGISIFQQKTVDLLCPGAVIILKEEKNEHIFTASELYDRLLNPISRMFVEKFMVNPKYLFVHTMSEAKKRTYYLLRPLTMSFNLSQKHQLVNL